jgi:hypothetical protein
VTMCPSEESRLDSPLPDDGFKKFAAHRFIRKRSIKVADVHTASSLKESGGNCISLV